MNRHDSTQKITPEHLARKAVVYLRQSSMAQVKHNQESQRLQYALADTAKAYGFKHVEIVDCDLGMSAATGAQAREGFKRVLASVALGEVGIVLSRELSRLSRTDKDWCQLMELCQIFNTLIADAENLYDLNRLDDQLVLGIKGTLSVVELKTLKFRLQQGREEKAKRGELGRCLASVAPPSINASVRKSLRPSHPSASRPVPLPSNGSVIKAMISGQRCNARYNRWNTRHGAPLISITRSTPPIAWSPRCSSNAGTTSSKHSKGSTANSMHTATPPRHSVLLKRMPS